MVVLNRVTLSPTIPHSRGHLEMFEDIFGPDWGGSATGIW